jgi:hypothetical protein
MEGEAPTLTSGERIRILEQLIQADCFEEVLHARYKGTKRFSLEGITALLPLLEEIIETAAERGGEQVQLAMSHRGRLNVMAHVVGRPVTDIFAGFEDVDPRSVLGSGDVKYHLGATAFQDGAWREVRIHLVSNPSHLEAVVPVTLGRCGPSKRGAGRTASAPCCRCCCTATRRSRPGHHGGELNLQGCAGSTWAAQCTWWSTTSSGSRRRRRSSTRRASRPTWPSACRFPSSTSTPKTPRRWCGWRSWRRNTATSLRATW